MFKVNDLFKESFVISERIHQGFVDVFNDKNPLHVDHEYAVNKGFLSVVMHGNILNGFLSYFIGECLPVKNVIIHSQEIQFKKPVYLNQQLFFEAVISDIFESVNAIQFKFKFSNSEKIVVAKGMIQIGKDI